MARVTPKRKEEIENYLIKWEKYASENPSRVVSMILFESSLSIIRELLNK